MEPIDVRLDDNGDLIVTLPPDVVSAHVYGGSENPVLLGSIDRESDGLVFKKASPVEAKENRTMTLEEVLQMIENEVEAATRKFPTWPTDPLHALAVVGEEFGELTKDVLQLTYEPCKTTSFAVQYEAIQTAAMAVRFLMSLDQYDYRQATQHKQGEGL